MNPLDKIISQSVKDVLEEDLGSRTYKKIEKELDEMFGVSVLEAAGDFSKLDIVLRKLFGKNSTKIEMKIFKKVIAIEKKEKEEWDGSPATLPHYPRISFNGIGIQI